MNGKIDEYIDYCYNNNQLQVNGDDVFYYYIGSSGSIVIPTRLSLYVEKRYDYENYINDRDNYDYENSTQELFNIIDLGVTTSGLVLHDSQIEPYYSGSYNGFQLDDVDMQTSKDGCIVVGAKTVSSENGIVPFVYIYDKESESGTIRWMNDVKQSENGFLKIWDISLVKINEDKFAILYQRAKDYKEYDIYCQYINSKGELLKAASYPSTTTPCDGPFLVNDKIMWITSGYMPTFKYIDSPFAVDPVGGHYYERESENYGITVHSITVE